jgi:hypothetical protein
MSEYKEHLPDLIDKGEVFYDALASWLGNRAYELPVGLKSAIFVLMAEVRTGLARLRNFR